jgi:hypothetical protein
MPEVYGSEAEWRSALADSSVRLQWDSDHDPSGAKVERRAIQLGLRGDVLARYAREWVVRIEDVSPFVAGHAARPINCTQGAAVCWCPAWHPGTLATGWMRVDRPAPG